MSDNLASAEVNIHLRARSQDRAIIDQAAELVGASRSQFMLASALKEAKTILLDQSNVRINSATGEIHLSFTAPDGSKVDKKYTAKPAGIGKSVQEIYTAGGLEKWVKERI